MKVGIMQPYFLPYLGYWQLIKAVDTYVVYDDVNYIVRGWINRNNLLINGEKKLFTISLKEASRNKLINAIEIVDDFSSFTKMVQHNYVKAPYYKEAMELSQQIISYDRSSLSLFITNSIKVINNYLNIETKTILSSSLDKDNSLKGKDKIISICKLLNTTDYYNAIGGQELYDKEEFLTHGISLYFLKTNISPYKQFSNDFVSGLSILDVMMFNSKEDINKMLDNYELI
ncbi:hypothetical protein FACS189494_04270 [Spirochaetia bacterium]|nr:hypothetical protein FACS189494_04270 [Spirochaetia bacterium]